MATRTISNTGGNWNAVGTWVEGVVPINGDAVVATATSGQLTVNVASACTSIDFTNYTNTLTMTSGLTVSGNVTLVIAMTIAGAGVLSVIATGTLTSNAKTWSSGLLFAGTSQTYTLADAWTVTGTLTCNATTALTVNGSTLNMSGNFTVGAAGIVGTTSLVMNGTGTWSGAGTLKNNLTFNSAGTITIGSVSYNTGTLTYTAGTMSISGTLSIALGTTLNTNGMSWSNITLSVAITVTNNSALTMDGLLTLSGSGTYIINGSDWTIKGGYTASSGRNLTGTAKIIFGGSGTQSITMGNLATITNNVDFNSSGTINMIGAVIAFGYGGGTLTYIAGSVNVTGGGSLWILSSCTLNTNGVNWFDIGFTGTSTLTINSLLTATGTVTLSTSNISFLGSAGFSFANVSTTTGDHILKSGNTYTITTSILSVGTLANRGSFTSSVGASQAILTLTNNGTSSQDIDFCNATDIDSSAGLKIWSYKGVLSNATNWGIMPTQPQTIASAG